MGTLATMLIALVVGVLTFWCAAMATAALARCIYESHYAQVIRVTGSMKRHCFWCAFWLAFVNSAGGDYESD